MPLPYRPFCSRTGSSYCSRLIKKWYTGTSALRYNPDVRSSARMPVTGRVDLIRFIYDPLPVQRIIDAPVVEYIGMKQKQVGTATSV